MKYTWHVCSFDSTGHIRGRARTYETVKAAALEAGRFSTFEASDGPKNQAWFTELMRDPEIEKVDMPFPWVGVRRRPAQPPSVDAVDPSVSAAGAADPGTLTTRESSDSSENSR